MDFNGLFGGMGLLLFGLYLFEEMLKYFGGRRLKSIILKYTTGSWQSIFIGMILAGILSSSSLLTILVIALTGAGLMPLKNAIGIVIGSNIGTTFDDFLIAQLGFGMSIDISAFALPLVGIAGIITILTKNDKMRNLAKLFFGFGLVFIGLFFVKQTASGIESAISLDQFQDMPLIVFGLLGMGITAVVQLMGVVAIITFTALDAGIITFPASIAILMGANMGATVNAVLSSLGGRTIKRQVALSHVLFNGISTIIGAIFFRNYIRLTNTVFGFGENVVGSGFFNVIFNVSTAILFGFFLTPFTKLVEKLIPANEQSTKLTVEQFSLNELDSHSIDATTTALSNDIKSVTYLLIVYVSQCLGIKSEDLPNIGVNIQENVFKKYASDDEAMLTQAFDEKIAILLQYYLHTSKYKLHTDQLKLLTELYKSMNALIMSKKNFDLCIPEIKELEKSQISEIKDFHTELINKLINGISTLLLLQSTTNESMITSGEFIAFESQRKDIQTEIHKQISHLIKVNNEEIPVSSLITISTYLPFSLTNIVSAVKHSLKN